MSATLKLNVDVSQARTELASLGKVLSKANIGGEIGKQIKVSMQDLEKHLTKMAEKSLTLESSPKEMKEFVQGYKEAEQMQQKINEQIRQQLDLRLQEQGVTANQIQTWQKSVEQNREKLQMAQQEVSLRQQYLTTQADDIRQNEINIKRSQTILETEKEKLNTLKEGTAAYKEQQTVVARKEDILNKHLAQSKEYERQRKEIVKIEQEILALQSEIEMDEAKLQQHQEEVNLLGETEEAIRRNVEARKADLEAAKQSKNEIKAAQEEQIQQQNVVEKNVENISNKMKRLAEYTVAAFAIRYIRRFAQEGLRFVADLDKSLTEIATVTGRTRQEMWGMAEEFNRMGRELGRTTNEIAQASTLFYRQGLETNQVLEMVRASTISAGIANTDTADASDRLTAAIRGFLQPASAAMDVADKLAALAATSASSFDELSYAMTKTAASAQVAGIDMDHLFAYIAKVVEATREAPENIGTAFKTIIARMQQVKEAGVIVEDGVTTPLNKVQEALGAVNVELLDSQGQLRDLQEVFTELGQVWDQLDRNTKAYLATIIAGLKSCFGSVKTPLIAGISLEVI